MVTPLPREMYPIILSPGRGLQHLASFVSKLENPLTTISPSFLMLSNLNSFCLISGA